MTKTQQEVVPIERADEPISAGVKIGHVHLKTANIERVKRFYVGVLGFDVVAEMPQALFLSAGGYHHHLAFNTWESENGSPPPLESTGLYHVAISYPSRQQLGNALWRLQRASWPLEGASDHGTHEALYLNDPDMNGVELYWDRPKNQWPLDEHGHLLFTNGPVDVRGLLVEGQLFRDGRS